MTATEEMLLAAGAGDEETARRLLDGDPELVRARDGNGNTPLTLACMAGFAPSVGHARVVRLLLERGADPNERGANDNVGEAAAITLAAFAGAGNLETVQALLDHGADPNDLSGEGVTPLATAAAHGESEICEALISAGARVDIHVAGSLGLAEEIQGMLWQEPELVRARDDYLRATALYHAAQQDRRAAASVLLDFGADPNAESASGDTPLHVAAAAPALATMKVLLEHGGSVNARNHRRQTPLHRAVEEWWAEATEVVQLLVSAGADVNARDQDRQTALSRALDRNKTHIVDLLRKAGARE